MSWRKLWRGKDLIVAMNKTARRAACEFVTICLVSSLLAPSRASLAPSGFRFVLLPPLRGCSYINIKISLSLIDGVVYWKECVFWEKVSFLMTTDPSTTSRIHSWTVIWWTTYGFSVFKSYHIYENGSIIQYIKCFFFSKPQVLQLSVIRDIQSSWI